MKKLSEISKLESVRLHHGNIICPFIRYVARLGMCIAGAVLMLPARAMPQTSAATGFSVPRSNLSAATPDTQADFLDDARLEQKVTLACKQVSFHELCRQLQAAVGITFATDASVADDNVTLFCYDRPARDILQQTARFFCFTWKRSGDKTAFRYELTQTPLQKAQEEQLRQQDHLSALALFQAKMEAFRPYLNLRNEQLDALQEKATATEQQNIRYFRNQRASITMYLSLSDGQKLTLLDGKTITFSTQNDPNGLPPLVKAAIFDKFKDVWAYKTTNGGGFTRGANVVSNGVAIPEGPHVVDAPDAYALLEMQIKRDKAGKYSFIVGENLRVPSLNFGDWQDHNGSQPMPARSAIPLDNARANAALARDPQMRQTVTLAIKPTYATAIASPPMSMPPSPAITDADYQEAVNKATGMDIIADGFERLVALPYLKTEAAPLFDALNFNCDFLRLRWNKEAGWLQFRKPGYFDLRGEQVPNRLLERWAAFHREHGAATIDDLAEMAQWGGKLEEEETDEPRAHVNPHSTLGVSNPVDPYVVGVYGLREWLLARQERLRPHWQLLALLPPELRRLATTPTGLPFARIPLQVRPAFIAQAVAGLKNSVQPGLPEMINAVLRVQYTPASRPRPQPASADAPTAFTVNGRAVTLNIQTNLPPPDWKVKFIYSFGSKRAGQWRHVIEPNSEGFLEPGEKD